MFTELELVNHILQTLGESTTPTLETQHPSVQQAQKTLMTINKEFQGYGWWFNREYNVKLLPDAEGKVRTPAEVLSFQVTQCMLEKKWPDQKRRFVVRNSYIWDNLNHTDIINTAIWADYVVLLPYEDLPAQASVYLMHLAAERAFLDDDGDINNHSKLQQRVQMAYAKLKQEEMRVNAANAMESPHALNVRLGPTSGSTLRGNFLGGYYR